MNTLEALAAEGPLGCLLNLGGDILTGAVVGLKGALCPGRRGGGRGNGGCDPPEGATLPVAPVPTGLPASKLALKRAT